MLPPSQFSYRRGLGTCDALLTLSHRLQVGDRASHCGLLYKLRSIGVWRTFVVHIVLEFLSDRRQRVCLDGKVSESVDVISGIPQASVLRSLLIILYTSELLHIIGISCCGLCG